MNIHHDFEPDACRARELDRRMHLELAASVRYLSVQSAAQVPHDRAAIEAFAAAIEKRDERCGPMTFNDYYDCGAALLLEDWGGAQAAFQRLSTAPLWAATLADTPRIEPLHDLAQCERSRRMVGRLLEAGDLDMGILPPSASVAQRFGPRFAAGLSLLADACPELAGEVRALVREVVPIASDRTRKFDLDGGSHYRLWGALFLNAGYHPTPHAMAEVIAHESAHSLLFGLCVDEALTLNDGTARYKSPLRLDPRPMEGIYHATFVSARMHYAMSRLLECGRLDALASAEVRAARDADARNFELGFETVRRYGELTDTGAALMRAARDYMDFERKRSFNMPGRSDLAHAG